jgi:hypothetical protein
LSFSSRCLAQGARAQDFVFAQDFESGRGDGGDRDRVAHCIENFDGIAFRAVKGYVAIHQFDNVAAPKPMLRQVAGQHRISVKFQFHPVFRLSGIKVTNFVLPDKCSVIQMVRTPRATPFYLDEAAKRKMPTAQSDLLRKFEEFAFDEPAEMRWQKSQRRESDNAEGKRAAENDLKEGFF